MAAQHVGEYQVPAVVPRGAGQLPLLFLPPLFFFQELKNRTSDHHDPSTAVLRWHKGIVPADLFCFLELFVDIEGTAVKIHAVPCQPQDLTLPQAREQRDLIQPPILVPFQDFQEGSNVLLFHWPDLLVFDLGKVTEIGRIASDHLELHSPVQRPVQDPMDILDGFGGESMLQ